jgi:L-fucose isomerase-like protein
MNKTEIKLGYCPTRRDVFSAEAARQFNKEILTRIKSFDNDNLKIININDVTEEGLLIEYDDVQKVIRLFRKSEVDAVFFPHCNFGSEGLVSEVAAALKVPVLLWGPRDEGPDEGGYRKRDTQCGMFATGKVLRRFNVPFTYLTNTFVEDVNYFHFFLRIHKQ